MRGKAVDYINTEIFKWKHEKEIVQKLIKYKIQFIANISKNIDDIIKLNPKKINIHPKIHEADYLDINGKPFGDWKGYRKRRREAGMLFPMANYNFRDPAGFNILHDDCEDMLDLLQSRAEDHSIDFLISVTFPRCYIIAARFNYLNGIVSVNAKNAPDFLFAEISTAFASKAGEKGGSKEKICQPILKALQQFLEEEPDLIQQSNKAITEKFTEWLLSDDRYITHAGRDWYIYYVQDSKCIFAEPDKTTKTSKITSKKIGTIRTEYIPKIKNPEK